MVTKTSSDLFSTTPSSESVHSYERAPFTFCIDGGGSKTLLQVIDAKGDLVPLSKNGELSVASGSSNINVVKEEGVKIAFDNLFKNLKVGTEQRDLREILPSSRVIAGMAGVGLPKNLAIVTSLLVDLGVQEKNLQVLTDAEVALRLLKGRGLVVISGTGSICFTENTGVRQRVGGLG